MGGQYFSQFSDNKIDLDVVRDLSEADLKVLGLALGDRKRFLQAVAALSNARAEKTRALATMPSTPSQGERRQMTILFCDLVGSTALVAKLDPEALSKFMQDYRKACTETVSRYEGLRTPQTSPDRQPGRERVRYAETSRIED